MIFFLIDGHEGYFIYEIFWSSWSWQNVSSPSKQDIPKNCIKLSREKQAQHLAINSTAVHLASKHRGAVRLIHCSMESEFIAAWAWF